MSNHCTGDGHEWREGGGEGVYLLYLLAYAFQYRKQSYTGCGAASLRLASLAQRLPQ
jgi:hypothetical protein